VPATTPRPATGPYMIDEYRSPSKFTLVRNQYFHEPWSVAAQPEGYPDKIEWTSESDPNQAVSNVLAGSSDVDQRTPFANDPTLVRANPDNFHSSVAAWTTYLFLNTRRAPFDNPDVRRAINYAVDRNVIVRLVGGAPFASPTCQILAPNLPGYRPNCPYTANPDPDGSYHGPDFARGSALVDHSGTRGMAVTVVSPWPGPAYVAIGRYVAHVLDTLGYKARFALSEGDNYFSRDNPAQLGIALFAMDYPVPSNFFEELRCDAQSLGRYCSHVADELFTRALETPRSDQVRADGLWTALDRTVTDDAARLPLYTQGWTVALSDRVGNYLSNPKYGPLFGQMWVR
jgi:peptide/nickel transport system substrate-binding protein